MSLQDEDSPFEAALKGDLPSGAEQARVRQRLLGAGISVGSGLAASSAVASAQVGWGATLAAKVGALSLAAKVGLVVAVAAPLIAVPVLRRSAAHHAARESSQARATPSAVAVTLAPMPQPALPSMGTTNTAPAVGTASIKAAEGPPVLPSGSERALAPALHTEPSAASTAALPAVAAFDSLANHDTKADSERARATTLAAETKLLDRAFAEIAAGHRDAAAALIAEHQRRFPNGLLSQERERARARLEQSSQGE